MLGIEDKLASINEIIEWFVNLITLGLFKDIINLLPESNNPASLALAWSLHIARYVIIAFIIYSIAKRVLHRYALLVTAIATVLIVVLTQPWIAVEETAERISGVDAIMKDYSPTKYKPSLLSVNVVNNTLNTIYSYAEVVESSVAVVRNATSIKVGIPYIENYTVKFKQVSFEWLFYLLTLIAIFITFYILKHLNKYLAVVVALSLFAIFLLGVDVKLIFTIALILALFLSAWYVFKHVKILAVYPIVIAIMLILSLIELPKLLLFCILISLMYISLIPVFYVIGSVIAEVGEIIERREKFGMKVKPKKVIEERTGEWDKLAVAIILSAVFLVAIVLFGANMYGLATFIGLTISLFRS